MFSDFQMLFDQAQQDISSIVNIAGETKKKLGTLASGIFSDIQDRML